MEKYVYFFGGGKAEGDGNMKEVLGGKGAGLAEMTNAGPAQGGSRHLLMQRKRRRDVAIPIAQV